MATDEKQGILLESGTNEVEIAEFIVGGQALGINVAKIQQIMMFDKALLTPIPQSHASVKGMFMFRERTIPLIDLNHALWGKYTEFTNTTLVMVTEFSRVTVAFLISGAERIHRLSWTSLQPMSQFVIKKSSYLSGTVHADNKDILIVDLEHLTADIAPDITSLSDSEKLASMGQKKERSDVKILFAEDSTFVRKVTVKKLKSVGYTGIEEKINGQEAYDHIKSLLETAKKENKDITEYMDVLLTDIEMPKMDGLTLCRKVKEELHISNVPVVLYSSLMNKQMEVKAKSVNADASLTKPKVEQIVECLDNFFTLE